MTGICRCGEPQQAHLRAVELDNAGTVFVCPSTFRDIAYLVPVATPAESAEADIQKPLLEIARLERLLLDGDGWKCDGCSRVFGPDDTNHGHDCDLCEACATDARSAESRRLSAVKS